MIKDKDSIIIKNIYYMLSYAYQSLQHKNYEKIKTEAFDNVYDMFASILSKGIAFQLKQGLLREYTEYEEKLPVLRGKADIIGSAALKAQRKTQLLCRFDELSENNHMNQILKTTIFKLIQSNEVKKENRIALKRMLPYFSNVDYIEPSDIHWNMLTYHRNNQRYKMLMNICYLVLDKLLLTTDDGKVKFAKFIHSQEMSHLYEKFILEYYIRHYPELKPSPRQIPWDTDGDFIDFLPKMITDITLSYGEKTLIIDAKYYSNTMQRRRDFNSETLRSAHLYQIYAYVKNKDKNHTGNVSGMLLYAKTDEDTMSQTYNIGGNKFMIQTLDLSKDFSLISMQLNKIADDFMI